MSTSSDRIDRLELELAELQAQLAAQPPRHPRSTRRRRAFVGIVLAAAVAIVPALALASHQFSDVPTTHRFHNDIAAIYNAGVTVGCGSGKYCPDGLVTRGQMAAFLNRLGALSAGKKPVVNADRVDGVHARDIVLWAVVAADGALQNGNRATGAAREPLGDVALYYVTFNRDVSGCAYDATPREIDAVLAAHPRPGHPNTVTVTSHNNQGLWAFRSFSLSVYCVKS